MTLTAHQLAARQLAALETASEGALRVVSGPRRTGTDSAPGDQTDVEADFVISLDLRGLPVGDGITIGPRERFLITIPDSFPFTPPAVDAAHRRWAGTPHVQWGSRLCLFAAPSVEWVPAEGMRGFVERLLLWLERAAEGTLDPDGQPLHPPVAYPSHEAGHILVHPDLGDHVPWTAIPPVPTPAPKAEPVTLFAWCIRNGGMTEVLEWLDRDAAFNRVLAEDLQPADAWDRPYFLIPLVLITSQIGWEYPLTGRELAAGLQQSGLSRLSLLRALTTASKLNRYLRFTQAPGSNLDADPVAMLLGTPSRRIDGTSLLAHLAGWRLDELGHDITSLLGIAELNEDDELASKVVALAHRWLDHADVGWMYVHEARPEVTRRRDDGTPLEWLRGKRVLVLGCGAVGAPIAEYCVRAGATRQVILDDGTVNPGILVRQPYAYKEIGVRKAYALAARLNNLTREPTTEPLAKNAIGFLLAPDFDAATFDLIIDATADAGVRATLERVRASRREAWPPVATMIIGHRAGRGLVTVTPTAATGAGHDILRRIAIRARSSARRAWSDVADDFFPDPPRTETFSPEPGCSAPTFVASAAEVTALASGMLTQTLRILTSSPDGTDTPPTKAAPAMTPMTAAVIRPPSVLDRQVVADVLTWDNDLVCTDATSGYEIRIAREALVQMRAETRRGARVRGPAVETGGMLLGAFDEATGIVNIDVATGPPPDSLLAEEYFRHGTDGAQALIDHHRNRTADLTGFAGMWHTHPYGKARPSPVDEAGMATIVAFPGSGTRALMLILAGHSPLWEAWTAGKAMPQMYVRVIDRADHPCGDVVTQPAPPKGTYFPGGYAVPSPLSLPSTPLPARWTAWWRRGHR